jgi:hypothetical protein
MNKDLIKLALIGVAAGFCLSAKEAPSTKNNKEIAMSKCTKDNGQKKNGHGNGSCSSCGSDEGDSSCSSNCSNQGDQSDASTQMKGKRRSAAQKVLQGK